jgi:hypothetical protein
MRAVVVTLTLALLAAACGSTATEQRQASDEWNVREVVFRYQFANADIEDRGAQAVYFMGLDEGEADPPGLLLDRFAVHSPPVMAAGRAERTLQGVSRADNGDRGVLFFQGDIDRVNDRKVIVEGGFFQHQRSSATALYHVNLLDGKWVVTVREMKSRA